MSVRKSKFNIGGILRTNTVRPYKKITVLQLPKTNYRKEEKHSMEITIQQTEKLLKGTQPFSELGFSLMLTRLRTQYAKNPSQPLLQSCMGEINAFLKKFSAIMNTDYAIITKM